MQRKLKKLFLLLTFCLVFTTQSFAQDTVADVHVQLSLSGDKTTYRIGEPIILVLSFTADKTGYNIDTVTTNPASPSDDVIVSPDINVFHWLDDYSSAGRFATDVLTEVALSSKPTEMRLPLNQWVRFDAPGHYTVRVTTSRLHHGSSKLTTNEVGIDIVSMSQSDEQGEVERITAALQGLDPVRQRQAVNKLTEELAFLTGDNATREKVRRYLQINSELVSYDANRQLGLYIARNRKLIVQLLESAFKDKSTLVTTSLIGDLSSLREKIGSKGNRIPRPVYGMEVVPRNPSPVFNAYLKELMASLPDRAGESQTTAAMTILFCLPDKPEDATEYLKWIRPILLRQFDSLSAYSQQYILDRRWEQFRDPALLPAIKRMLEKSGGSSGYQNRTAGIKRLQEIAPDEARDYIVAEILRPYPQVEIEVLVGLKDGQLPEIDSRLGEQIKKLGSENFLRNSSMLRLKASLAARYATSAIYRDIFDLYQTYNPKWTLDSRAAVLSYLVKWNEAQTIPLVRKELATSQWHQSSFLTELTREYYSDAIDSLMRELLAGDDPETVSTAAYIISLHGPEADKEVLESRLDQWISEWQGKVDTNAENSIQSMTQVNLINALLGGKTWKVTEAQARKLKEGCLTSTCRERYQYIK